MGTAAIGLALSILLLGLAVGLAATVISLGYQAKAMALEACDGKKKLGNQIERVALILACAAIVTAIGGVWGMSHWFGVLAATPVG